jgi:uncharacterized membrane protein (DUF485 family)
MSNHSKIDTEKFQGLVRSKWSISLSLSALMLVIYYGFILVLAFNKEVLSQRIGEHMTLGIPIGLGVILSACVLTGIYVNWANTTYDKTVKDIIDHMKR